MALEDILRSIRADTDAQIREIEAATAAEVASIAARADAEATRVEGAAAASRDGATAREVARTLDLAHLDARRDRRRAIEDAYQDALVDVRTALAAVRGTEAHTVVFRRLLDESLGVLGDATRLSVDDADVEIARAAAHAAGAEQLVVESRGSTVGGLDLATDDGRVVHNTFESRLIRADGRLRCLVSDALSEDDAR